MDFETAQVPDRRVPIKFPPASTAMPDELIGGGRRLPSPPPVQTPTRLRSKVKATERDTGLVRDAGTRRALLIPNDSAPHAAEIEEVAQERQIPCANTLFDGVPSQSPFLTCKVQFAEPQQTSGTADRSETARPTSVSGDEEEHGRSSPRPARVVSPRIPPTPQLLDLKKVLSAALVERDTHRNDAAATVPHHDEAGAPPQTEDGTNEETPQVPRAAHPPPLSTLLDWDLYDEDAVGLDIPDHRQVTPTPASRSKPRSEPLIVAVDATHADTEDKVASILGRTPARVKTILNDAFQDIHSDLSQLAIRVDMPFHQVLNGFMKRFSRICANNFWNSYQKFHAANKEQENARIGQADITASTPGQAKKCYPLFQEAYPETWQEILTDFHAADKYNDEGKSVGHRQALFARLAKQHCQTFTSMAKAHAFEVVMIMAGNVVNQDASLGQVYTSPGAENFFLERCRADDNEVLAHFKTHIYNRQSLANVSLAFDGLACDSSTVTKKPLPVGGDEPEIVEIVDTSEMADHARVRWEFISALTKLGQCEWATRKLFPWKVMPSKLAISSVVCHNFPDSVPFPGEDHRPRSKSGSKGISDLSLAECSILIDAFSKDPKEGGLYFEHNPKIGGDLRTRKLPVIIGTAPELDSPHQFGKRMFADGSFDRTGPPRPVNRAATRIKKKKGNPPPPLETITIPDSDDNSMQRKGKQKALSRPPTSVTFSLSESEEIQKVVNPPAEKRSLPLRKRRPAQESKDVSSEAEVQDISSPSGSEFNPEEGGKQRSGVTVAKDEDEDEDGTTSEGAPETDGDDAPKPRKRKAKGELASRPPKKRVVVEVQPASKLKGKAPARSLKRGRVAASPASSDDEGGASVSKGVALDEPSVMNAVPEIRERPKPRQVMKGKAAEQDGTEPFSRRKQPANTATQTGSADAKKIAPSDDLETSLMSNAAGASVHPSDGAGPSTAGAEGAKVPPFDPSVFFKMFAQAAGAEGQSAPVFDLPTFFKICAQAYPDASKAAGSDAK